MKFSLLCGSPSDSAPVHTAGELAYLDTFAGLVPCRVVSVDSPGSGWVAAGEGEGQLTVRLTATRQAYQKGETLSDRTASQVVPRANVRRTRFGARIVSQYTWR